MDRLVQLIKSAIRAPNFDLRMGLIEDVLLEIGPMLNAYILKQCGRSRGEDVCQEAQIAFATSIESFAGNSDQELVGWAFGIARNKVRSSFRSKSRDRVQALDKDLLDELLDAAPDATGSKAGEALDHQLVAQILRETTGPCFDYLWGRYALELDFKTLGANMGKTEDAARMRTERCLEKAQKIARNKIN